MSLAAEESCDISPMAMRCKAAGATELVGCAFTGFCPSGVADWIESQALPFVKAGTTPPANRNGPTAPSCWSPPVGPILEFRSFLVFVGVVWPPCAWWSLILTDI